MTEVLYKQRFPKFQLEPFAIAGELLLLYCNYFLQFTV